MTADDRPARRSLLEVTRDVVLIVAGLVFVALVVAVLFVGGQVIDGFHDQAGLPPDPDPSVPCVSPATDEYGTFCPETPTG